MNNILAKMKQHYFISVISMAIFGIFLIVKGINHDFDYDKNFPAWTFDPFLIAIGGGFLVFAKLLYSDVSNNRNE